MQQFFVEIKNENPNRRLINGLVALLTGAFTLVWPEFLTTIIAAYLIATGIVYLLFRSATFIGAVAIVAGIFIFAYPVFIPYAFAVFLLILAFGTIMSGGLTFLGIIAFIFGLIILSNPFFVNTAIAAFLLFYGVMGIGNWIQSKRNR